MMAQDVMSQSMFALALLAFATGATSKFADLLNEHGLAWFKYAGPLFGIVWGVLAVLLVRQNPLVAALWLATILYWFLRIKLDYFNHSFAGVLVTIECLRQAMDGAFPFEPFLFFLIWLTIVGYMDARLKTSPKVLEKSYAPLLLAFLRLRLIKFYVAPIALSLYTGDPAPAVAVVAGMIGTEIVTVWFDRYEARRKDPVANFFGFSLREATAH